MEVLLVIVLWATFFVAWYLIKRDNRRARAPRYHITHHCGPPAAPEPPDPPVIHPPEDKPYPWRPWS